MQPGQKQMAGHTEVSSFGSPAVFFTKDPLLSAPFSQRVRLYRE